MLVHCTDTVRAREVMGRRGVESASWIDAGAACAHLALMAQSLGLGTCTITSTVPTMLAGPLHRLRIDGFAMIFSSSYSPNLLGCLCLSITIHSNRR